MEGGKYQKELFEFEEPKRPFSRLAKIFPKPDFEGKVAIMLTLEKILFISIGIIMLMILVYALGVENGKSRTSAGTLASSAKSISAGSAQTQKILAAADAVAVIAPGAAANPVPTTQNAFFNTAPAAPSAIDTTQDKANPYTIVAATFSKKDTCEAAVELLKRDGLQGFVRYSAPYYQVCVGKYADNHGAQINRDLGKVRRSYKDAYVKLR